MPVLAYRRDFELIGLILITVFHDAIYSLMPPLFLILHYVMQIENMKTLFLGICPLNIDERTPSW